MNNDLDSWLKRFRATANRNAQFLAASEWLDVRILLRVGDAPCWLKVYRSQVIDAMAYAPATNRLGYDVVVAGATPAWQRVASRSSLFGREVATGGLAVDGHRTEGDKSFRALVVLGDQVLTECGLPPQAS